MIYVTGDCHGDFQRFTKQQRKQLPFALTEHDSMLVCGDLGLLWARDKELEYNLQWLSRLPCRILWVQGNHENYDMIAEYPLESWHGGYVRQIVRDRIILLERGEIFELEGKRFLTFGGASSHDVQGGILDRTSPNYQEDRRRAVKRKLPYRVKHESWWEQELPTEEEMQRCRDNLSKVNYKVDYVITHCLSSSMQEELEDYYGGGIGPKLYEQDILTDFFEELEEKLQYRLWICGHYHLNLRLDEKHMILYKDIRCLEDF